MQIFARNFLGKILKDSYRR